jgi:hypothetical protein
MDQPTRTASANSTGGSGLRKAAIFAGVAAFVASGILLLGFYSINSRADALSGIFFILFFIPTIVICENLGLGHFSILGPSTIPDWMICVVGILWVYAVSLLAVVALHILWSSFSAVGSLIRRGTS